MSSPRKPERPFRGWLYWLLQRPAVSSIIVGARDETQLRDNRRAIGWNLTLEQVARLDAASDRPKACPCWHLAGFPERNPPLVGRKMASSGASLELSWRATRYAHSA